MNRILSIDKKVLLLLTFVVVCLPIPLYFLMQEGTVGLLLVFFFILLIGISLVAGSVVGLFASLVFIFGMGSFLLFISFPETPFSFQTIQIPLSSLLMAGFGLLLFVAIAGRIHELVYGLSRENARLQSEVEQFVAVDVDTGFDNKYRMALEIDVEMKRVTRYGGTFTLILLQLNYLEDFSRLYGEKERVHLLNRLSDGFNTTMRSTDRKFRYAPDRFALLLTNTSEKGVDVIYEKLSAKLKTHQLLNGNFITLTFHIGHIVYDQNVSVTDYELLFSQVESEMVSHEL